ncbi:MAG: NADPH-dependent FMN reductase [Pseudomonadota bacterium]
MIHESTRKAGGARKLLLIMGSTRAGRVCPGIAAWVAGLCPAGTHFGCEVIDLAAWSLPMDDEPAIPALGPYAQSHTREWSECVAAADAVMFVTPQFNWGYPAVLKNAIDHLHKEWRHKPVAIVTYGGHGGTRCARQLRRVASCLRMRVAPTAPALLLPDAVIREGAALDIERDFARHRGSVRAAFEQLARIVDGRESLLARFSRRSRALLAAAT